jgi:hypothetical protein
MSLKTLNERVLASMLVLPVVATAETLPDTAARH